MIRYFAAPVMLTPGDPDAPARQAVYFRALETIRILQMHRGRMAVRKKSGVLLPETNPPHIATIQVFEEKRTDVNIASYLLMDAFEGRYDTTVVVSNDSDLTTLVEMAVNRLGKRVVYGQSLPCTDAEQRVTGGRIADYTRDQRFRAASVPVPGYAGR